MSSSKGIITLTAVAIFSMFFGAGNIVFPLQVGLFSGEQVAFALIGLLLTAILGPLLGLFSAITYEGKCIDFFCHPGRVIGLFFITLSIFLLGPFAVIPRCIVVAYASAGDLFQIDPRLFSLLFASLAFCCCLRQNWLLPLLGKLLSPLLLLSLLCVIGSALLDRSPLQTMEQLSPTSAFLQGLHIGFDTMDLVAAIFFSSSIWMMLFLKLKDKNPKKIAKASIISSIIGGALLALIYVGLALSAAFHADALEGIAPEKLLSTLALFSLGPYGAAVADIAIIAACFTTVVGLMQTIALLCHRDLLPQTVSYRSFLLIIAAIAVLFSHLGFRMICSLIHPLITICYPAIIILTLFNLMHKWYGFLGTKKAVYATLLLSTLFQSITWIYNF